MIQVFHELERCRLPANPLAAMITFRDRKYQQNYAFGVIESTNLANQAQNVINVDGSGDPLHGAPSVRAAYLMICGSGTPGQITTQPVPVIGPEPERSTTPNATLQHRPGDRHTRSRRPRR